jgi:hypothetical protein
MLITTGDAQEMANDTDVIIRTFYEKVFPYLDTLLPDSEEADQAALDAHCNSMALQVVQGKRESLRAKDYSGREFEMKPNAMGITQMQLDFYNDRGTVSYKNATGDHVLEFGLGWNKP